MWRSYLCLERSVPAIFRYGNIDNRLWEDKGESPAKVHLDWCQSRFGRPIGSAGPTLPPLATAFGWVIGRWILGSFAHGPGFDTSVCSVLWALFVSVTQGWVFCVIVSCLLSVFALFRVWVPAIQVSPKLVEMVRNKPYNYFWCLKVLTQNQHTGI